MKKKDELKILIVGSDSAECETLAIKFRALRYQTSVAKSAKEAQEILKKEKFDIVVSGEKSKNQDAEKLLSSIRDENHSYPKLFVISGDKNLGKEKYFELGVDGTFDNLFDARSLMNAVRKATMPAHLRWAVTLSIAPAKSISFEAKSFDELSERNDFNFGREGFSIKTDDLPAEGDRVEFHFQITDLNVNLKGLGKVQWVKEGQDSSYGIEIEHVDHEGLMEFVNWLKERDYKAFIPAS